ncbi:MAG: hypothetical protein PHX70_00805 [Clostridium sp.]|nr:hypothetical protein [Clostridium sp.]
MVTMGFVEIIVGILGMLLSCTFLYYFIWIKAKRIKNSNKTKHILEKNEANIKSKIAINMHEYDTVDLMNNDKCEDTQIISEKKCEDTTMLDEGEN